MPVSERGIDIRQSIGNNNLVFQCGLDDSAGAIVTSNTTSLYLYEVQNSGYMKSYDFNDNTFKYTALTTETLAMKHMKGNNGTRDTGIWLAIVPNSGFTPGGRYIEMVNNTGANPPIMRRMFQYGSGQDGSSVKKNQPLNVFPFLMTDSTTHAPATSKTVTVTRSIDGAAFAAGALSGVIEVGNGLYTTGFAGSDLNGNTIILRATATGADDSFERIVTVP